MQLAEKMVFNSAECVVSLSFERGKRAFALAALDVNGFLHGIVLMELMIA